MSIAARLRHTPLSDLLRGHLTARLDWRGQIASADLPLEVKKLVSTVVRATRLWKADRADVAADLIAHFKDGLDAGSSSGELVQTFGEPRQAARLIRSSKIHAHPITWRLFRATQILFVLLLVAYGALSIAYYSAVPAQKVNDVSQLVVHPENTPFRDIRLLADSLALDAELARENNEGKRVETDIVALMQLASQQKNAGTTHLSELTSLGLLNRAYDELDRTLVEKPQIWDDATIVRFAHRISIPRTAGDLISFRSERLMFQRIVQGTFTDNGRGDGRLCSQGWNFFQSAFMHSPRVPEQLIAQPLAAAVLQPGSLLLMSSRKEVVDEYDRIMAMNESMIRVPLRDADTNAPLLEAKALTCSTASRLRYAEVLSIVPSLQREAEIAEAALGQRDGLLIGLALEIYHRRHRRYPEALAQLTPELLPEVLPDRITGDPLKYRLISGKPLVYSVGVDRVDDGGRLPTRNGQPMPTAAAQWGACANIVHGDWVLYPEPRPAGRG